MPRIPLVFGSGLDRETGVLAMQPGGMEDLRNVHLLQGKYQVRRGFERILEFTDPSGNDQTHVLAGIAVLGKRAAIYVTYDSVNGKVNVWYGDGAAAWYGYIGEWEFKNEADVDLLPAGSDPPVMVAAEMNGIVLLAHDKNNVDARAQTLVVSQNPTTLAWELAFLTVDWDGVQKVRFRGVVKHLEYMIGWGWGTATEDRPELVRVSEPAEPTTFYHNDYWIPGDEGDPVVACYEAAETLLCFKETHTWELFGDRRRNFGQRLLDGLYGMAFSRLAVSIEGAVFAWTNEGPRVFSGHGTSTSLELPLELTLPEAYDLPTKGEDADAFAVYMPQYREVWWFFGRRVYALSIRVYGDWKWTYDTLGFDPHCGFRLPQAGYGLVSAPTGYPSAPSMSNITDTTADLTVTNNGQDGDETLEVFLRPAGGSDYSLHASFEVTGAASQLVSLTELSPGWDYDIAVRYRRGSYYTDGYESSDPDTWPATARTTFTTTLAALPTIDSGSWARASASVEQILVTVTPPYTGTGYSVELRRGGVLIYTFSDISGQEGYYDAGCAGEASNVYDCRLVTPYVDGAYTATSSYWGGPPAPAISSVSVNVNDEYYVDWANGASLETEVYDSLPSELEVDVMNNLRGTEAAGTTSKNVSVGAGHDGKYPWVGVRHKQTSFAVDDFSDISAMQSPDPIV